jgi:DNA-binding response OmpR family regulator
MSTLGSGDLREQALELGADQYYDKPINIAELMHRIQEMGLYSIT